MKVDRRFEILQWLVIAAMFAAAAIVWPSAPDRIPVHWNISGNADRYGGKFEGLLLLPIVALGLYLLLRFLPRIDPGRANYQQFARPYAIIRLATLVLLAALYAVTLLWVEGIEVDMRRWPLALIGVLFVVLGNVMGKLRPNWFAGVRTPWTLSSKRSWVKTHRLAGWLFVVVGLLFIVGALVGSTFAAVVPLVAAGVMTVILVAYSYLEWRKDLEKMPPSSTLPG
jgi:uncharacterized membrane protein